MAPILSLSNLTVEFAGLRSARKSKVVAVNDVSLNLNESETLGLVGESGSGKSTIGNAILGLAEVKRGRILYRGDDITNAPRRARREIGKHIQVVFQDPYNSLNPVRTIGQTLTEPLRLVAGVERNLAKRRAAEVLKKVGLPAETMGRYPAAFSGGQRQRIAIARALVLRPEIVICDEPTSALDLSVQAQILNLLLDLQSRFDLTYLFISHDIDVVKHMSHRAAVLLKGEVVEYGSALEVVENPQHEYTQKLIAAAPRAAFLSESS